MFYGIYLADVTERGLFESGMEKRVTHVFTGELVGMVDSAITVVTECGFVCCAKDGGFFFAADVTLDLHSLQA